MNFQQYYTDIFARFGYPLNKSTAVAESTIVQQEKAIGRIPDALRDFCLVAGREKRFTQSYNRLLPIDQWGVNKNRLVFMEENQNVYYWGVSVRNRGSADPTVSIGENEEEEGLFWQTECRKCSTFLAVTLHRQAAYGGFEFRGYGYTRPDLKRRLKADWKCYGTVNGMTAYSQQNKVVCLNEQFVEAGGKTKADLQKIGTDLEVEIY